MTDINASIAENTKYWDELKVTDPAFCENFVRPGGFKGTAVAPMYYVKRLTELFGPVGKGWGVEELDQRIVDIASSNNAKMMVFIQARVWWKCPDDEKVYHTPPTWGGDFIVTANSRGPVFDDDAFKKASTDAFSKAVTYLGLGADVHLGFFDDNKYIAAAQARTDAKKTAIKSTKAGNTQDSSSIQEVTQETSETPVTQEKSAENSGQAVHSITPPLGAVRKRISESPKDSLERIKAWAADLYTGKELDTINSDIENRLALLSA